MTSRSPLRLLVVLAALALATPAHADPAKCQKTLLTGLRKYKKTYLKAHEKCLDADNVGKITGPCPDVPAQVKIGDTAGKINPKIGVACATSDLTMLGYPTSCKLATPETTAETNCAALPVTSGSELAACLECWKAAELAEFVAIVYASHAVELCGSLDAASGTCSEIDCTTPQPLQHDLGDSGENDCQRAIGKAGFKYLLTREKILEGCGLTGQTRTQCFDVMTNGKVALALGTAETKKKAAIKNKCGNNRTPVASPPFCCRVGMGNSCMIAADRNDCTTNLMGTVQENKDCVAGSCSPAGGGGNITWWENCPEAGSCPGAAVGTMDQLIDCVDASADTVVDQLLCMQFPTGWPCPAEASTTTTTTSPATTTTSTTETTTSTTTSTT